ncbi:hypothetical protein V1525DRAFT_405909 [Lipomyces kononenkoae]|uniref:Uncharacterized protein n=1 Tax=Lipomyces kononenkoae TaxID=34357 RepID=A0ACC3SYN0_LIPKO
MYAPSQKIPNTDVYKRCEPYMSHLARAYRIRLEDIEPEITTEELDKYFEYVAGRYRRPKNVTLTADLAREYFHMAYCSGTVGYFDVVISASMHLPVKSNSDGTDKINRPENLFFCFKNSLQDKIVHAAKSKVVLDKVSTLAGFINWKHSSVMRSIFDDIQEEISQLHRMVHPDYKYSPRRGSVKMASTQTRL